MIVILLILIPVAFAGAVQPLLVGQAISILRDPSTSMEFLQGFTKDVAMNIVLSTLLISTRLPLTRCCYAAYIISVGGYSPIALLIVLPNAFAANTIPNVIIV